MGNIEKGAAWQDAVSATARAEIVHCEHPPDECAETIEDGFSKALFDSSLASEKLVRGRTGPLADITHCYPNILIMPQISTDWSAIS